MKLLLHQLKTELYSLRWALAVWAFVFTFISWLELTAWGVENKPGLLQNRPTTPAEVINWFVAIFLVLLTVLAHAKDVYKDKRALWHTRPVPPITLFGSKILLVILTVLVPVTLLVCIVYPPIAGWEFTLYFMAEIWVWSLAIILIASFINLQKSWKLTGVFLGTLSLGIWIYSKFEGTYFVNNTIQWWFAYTLIFTVIVLGFLYLALFKRNKVTPFWPAATVAIPLVYFHTIPLKIPWFELEKLPSVENITIHPKLDKNAKLSYGNTSGGRFSNGQIKPDRTSISYTLPDLDLSEGIIPQFIEEENISILLKGKEINDHNIFAGLGLWNSGSDQPIASYVFKDYTAIKISPLSRKTDFKVSIGIADKEFRNAFRENSQLKLTDTKARIKGTGKVFTYTHLEMFRCKLSEKLSFHNQGVFASWSPSNEGGKFILKIVNTGLMTSDIKRDRYKNSDLNLLLVNHKTKEWCIAYLKDHRKNHIRTTEAPTVDSNHNRYIAELDISRIRKNWKRKDYSHDKEEVRPDIDEWLKNAELIVYRKVKTKDCIIDFDIEVHLPECIDQYLEQKGMK